MSRRKSLKSYTAQARVLLERLQRVTGAPTLAALARAIGVNPQNVNQAIKRGAVPDAWLYKLAYETGRRVEWLRTGEPPEFQNEAVGEARALYGIPMEIRSLAELWTDLDQEERATVQRCAQALGDGDADVRQHLIGQLKIIDETVRLRRGKQARASPRPRKGTAAS